MLETLQTIWFFSESELGPPSAPFQTEWNWLKVKVCIKCWSESVGWKCVGSSECRRSEGLTLGALGGRDSGLGGTAGKWWPLWCSMVHTVQRCRPLQLYAYPGSHKKHKQYVHCRHHADINAWGPDRQTTVKTASYQTKPAPQCNL